MSLVEYILARIILNPCSQLSGVHCNAVAPPLQHGPFPNVLIEKSQGWKGIVALREMWNFSDSVTLEDLGFGGLGV